MAELVARFARLEPRDEYSVGATATDRQEQNCEELQETPKEQEHQTQEMNFIFDTLQDSHCGYLIKKPDSPLCGSNMQTTSRIAMSDTLASTQQSFTVAQDLPIRLGWSQTS